MTSQTEQKHKDVCEVRQGDCQKRRLARRRGRGGGAGGSLQMCVCAPVFDRLERFGIQWVAHHPLLGFRSACVNIVVAVPGGLQVGVPRGEEDMLREMICGALHGGGVGGCGVEARHTDRAPSSVITPTSGTLSSQPGLSSVLYFRLNSEWKTR